MRGALAKKFGLPRPRFHWPNKYWPRSLAIDEAQKAMKACNQAVSGPR